MLLPTDLQPLNSDDLLGRGVFSSRQAKRWAKGKRERDSFLGAEHEASLSVDRLDLASDETMTCIAEAIVLTVFHASANGRGVRASPLLNDPYHADIDLNIRGDLERRDAQKQHADDLAARAHWRTRSQRV